jgi:putative transcriptional regulator
MIRLLAACVLVLCGTLAVAQGGAPPQPSGRPNGVFLVAKPDLLDPNFARTVVLVTQTEDFSTAGVIINRPTTLKLSNFIPEGGIETGKYRDKIFLGGPVMRHALVAVFQADEPPAAAAFHVLRKLYMTMHPDNMKVLLESGDRRYRLYAGFSGWAPRQLESEFNREGWYVLPADEEIVFRANTEGLWEELLQRAQGLKTRLDEGRPPISPRHKTSGPAEGGAGMPG